MKNGKNHRNCIFPGKLLKCFYMFSLFFRRRELRVRENILKGVYEDNLRMVGKHSHDLASRTSLHYSKFFFIFSVVFFIILTQGNYLTSTYLPETPTQASLVPQQSPISPLLEGSADSSDYQALLGKSNVSMSRMFGLGVRTIMIDAGHGGADSGTVGKMGTQEKDITLDIAKRLRQRLARQGNYHIIMTREDDSTLPLNRRVDLAQVAKADLFISIHLNYLPQKPLNIIETYYFGPSKDDKILRLAEKENAGSEYGMSDFKEIIEKMGERLKLEESREFAKAIQKNLFIYSRKQNTSIQDFGVKRAPFVVLLGVDVPAVLAEVSCLSNRDEEVQLNTEAHRESIARHLEAGILDYLHKGDTAHEAKRFAQR